MSVFLKKQTPKYIVEGNALNELCLLPQIISGTNSIVIDKTKVLFETFNDNIIVVSNKYSLLSFNA